MGDGPMDEKYTAIIRKSRTEYVAVCLELNVSARGDDLADVEKNLRAAIEVYKEDLHEHPETVVSPISSQELIEFFRDTEPEGYTEPGPGLILRPSGVTIAPNYYEDIRARLNERIAYLDSRNDAVDIVLAEEIEKARQMEANAREELAAMEKR